MILPPLQKTKRPIRSLVEMWALIRYRDMLMGWRDVATKVLTPIAICLFPMACYGSPGRMWEEFITDPSPDIHYAGDGYPDHHPHCHVCVHHHPCCLPVDACSEWKEIVDNESSCGPLQALVIHRIEDAIRDCDHGIGVRHPSIIQSVLFMRSPGLITVFSWASWSMMGVAHSLIWVCLYTLGMPFIWCLLTIIVYTAICFISHIGFLLRWPLLQQVSALTVEMSLILNGLIEQCPSPAHARVIRAIRSDRYFRRMHWSGCQRRNGS